MENIIFKKALELNIEIILNLYNFYVTSTTATFDHNPVSREELLQRIFLAHDKYQTFLIFYQGKMAGFCFLTQYRKKEAYDHTAEIGIYLKPEFTGKGIGRQAVTFLEQMVISKGIRVILASISGENTASLKLFQKMDYAQCAHYRQIGEKFGRFIDIIDYEKILPFE